jgi:hypothetical protein
MKNQSVNVTFSHNTDTESLTLMCSSVVFSLEFVGEVLELVDYSLLENYQDVRESIRIKVKLSLPESIFIRDFLSATDKKLTIDGTEYEIVNAAKEVQFPLFKNNNFRVEPTLNFKRKTVGVSAIGGHLVSPGMGLT